MTQTLEEKRIAQATYRAEHREEIRAYIATYYAEHPEKKRASQAKYYQGHREERLSYQAARCAGYSEEERAQRQAYQARYRAEHRTEFNAYNTNRRNRRRANGGTFPRASWEYLKVLFGHCCSYCGRRVGRLTQDHVVPISKGGWHFSGNMVPACQPCNRSKGTRV